MKLLLSSLVTAGLLASPAVLAGPPVIPPTKVSMETCMLAALKEYPGKVRALAMSIDNGEPVYEFTIRTKDGKKPIVECSADSGRITEVQWEGDDIDLEAFMTRARVSDLEARKIALQAVPGKVTEMEREMDGAGALSYAFHIAKPDGTEVQVEVDAVTGKIARISQGIYRIGDD